MSLVTPEGGRVKKYIFAFDKSPVSVKHVPKLKGNMPLIRRYEVVKRTDKGYRLRSADYPRATDKGTMYLDIHYYFFDSYSAALSFLAGEANKLINELDAMKSEARRLLDEIYSELEDGAV